jgi:hypothetical protein
LHLFGQGKPAMAEIVQVLTNRSTSDILARGGTGDWRANRDRLEQCRYVMMFRNGRPGQKDHRKPFLIAEVKGVERAEDEDDRWVITFSRYATLQGGETGPWEEWGNHRNPVYYTTTEEVDVAGMGLNWRNVGPRRNDSRQLSIQEAKVGLAETFGVSPESIEIVIKA